LPRGVLSKATVDCIFAFSGNTAESLATTSHPNEATGDDSNNLSSLTENDTMNNNNY
jgi:hypothetical protein